MIPPIIGLSGKAGVGKDTVATFLQAEYGGYTYAMADPLRAMLFAGLGIDMSSPHWRENKERPIALIGKSPRELLQTLGTEWGRKLVHPDIWLLMARQTYHRQGPGMIVTDVRFDNEAEWVRRTGGKVIHVERANAAAVNPHVSEAGIQRQPEDITLYNDSTLENLQHAVHQLFPF